MSTTDPEIPVFEPGEPGFPHAELATACGRGVFYLRDASLDFERIEALAEKARAFFSWSEERKLELGMEHGGRAWRGYFPPGGELTSGRPDDKEGLYFGQELPGDHPAVRAGTPLHGRNLYPPLEGFAAAVEGHMSAMEACGQRLLREIGRALGLEEDAFGKRLTREPLQLFRIFRYPPARGSGGEEGLGVGPHSDYGLLTLLWQDEHGGLQVRPRGSSTWIDVPPRPGTLVCNLGDMMERLSGGRCHSITHRVRGTEDDRLSMPYFLDPGYHVALTPLMVPDPDAASDLAARWDGESVHDFEGTYGDYLLRKVGRAFPALRADVLDEPGLVEDPEETS